MIRKTTLAVIIISYTMIVKIQIGLIAGQRKIAAGKGVYWN